MSPHTSYTTPSPPPSPSRSEKLLRDALIRDERERRHQSSPPSPTIQPTHRRSHTPTSSCSASSKENYASGSSTHTAMNVPSPCKTGTANSSTQPLPPFSSQNLAQQSQPHPLPSTKHFNARKASSECRAIQGYVSFASVEGLGEPPLVSDEFDGDGREPGKGNGENENVRVVAFLPLEVLNAALRWKKFVGGGPGISHGVEGKDQGLVM